MCWQRHEQVLADIDWHIRELDDEEARLLKTQQAMLVREVCFLRLLAQCLIHFESCVTGDALFIRGLDSVRGALEPKCLVSVRAGAVVASLVAEWGLWLDSCSICIAQKTSRAFDACLTACSCQEAAAGPSSIAIGAASEAAMVTHPGIRLPDNLEWSPQSALQPLQPLPNPQSGGGGLRADASELVNPPVMAAQGGAFASNQRQVRFRPAVHPQTCAM